MDTENLWDTTKQDTWCMNGSKVGNKKKTYGNIMEIVLF